MLRARANNTGTILCQVEFVKRVSYAENFIKIFGDSSLIVYGSILRVVCPWERGGIAVGIQPFTPVLF